MNTTAMNRIKDLNEGKVVRIFKDQNFYKISAMETMAAIVMTPEYVNGKNYYVDKITLTGHCTIFEAEELIKQLSE